MQQSEFDFDDFNSRVQKQREEERAEAEAGRSVLRSRLEVAEKKKDEIDAEIEGLTQQIAVINQFLGEAEQPSASREPSTPRDSGVKKTLEIIAPRIIRWSFEMIIDAVREYKPLVKDASVRSALARLVRDEVLEVEGFRANRTWNHITANKSKTETVNLLDEDPHTGLEWKATGTLCSVCKSPQFDSPGGVTCVNGHGGASAAEESESATIPAPAPEKVVDPETIVPSLQRRILNAAEQYADGVPTKVLAIIMDSLGATDEQFTEAVEKLVEDGAIEEGKSLEDEGGHVLRKPAEPGSKEELKRTPVQGRMGFPGMEQPPHL